MCKAHGKIVVHDPELWRVYVAGAEKAFQDRRRDFGDKAERSILEAVPGFDLRFGKKLEVNREYTKNVILRRSEEHTPEIQSLMRISYDLLCLTTQKTSNNRDTKNY